MCIPYKKDIMQESHTYYLLSKYMDHTISTEELKMGDPLKRLMRESYEICSVRFKIEREKNDSLWCLGNWLVSPQYY